MSTNLKRSRKLPMFDDELLLVTSLYKEVNLEPSQTSKVDLLVKIVKDRFFTGF